MSILNIFDIAASGMVAQSQRLNVVASNLANADSVAGPDGKAYKARQVVFQTAMVGNSASGSLPLAPAAPSSPASTGAPAFITNAPYVVSSNPSQTGVRVGGVVESSAPLRRVYEPSHPLADETGYVNMPNVNVVDEMVNMISASRSYQTNVEMMNTAKSMATQMLQIGS